MHITCNKRRRHCVLSAVAVTAESKKQLIVERPCKKDVMRIAATTTFEVLDGWGCDVVVGKL